MPTQAPLARPGRRSLLAGGLALGAGAPLASLSQPQPNAMTPTINADAKLTTLINVFSVAPEDRDRLVALLKEGTDAWISKVPGFVSSSLHVSRDGRRVVIYGQWRGADGIAAMRQHPEMPAYFERIKALAQMEAMTCDVASTVVA
jgi:quinol monooxygenase YgiN